jgi:hypothetical protein
MRKTQFLAAFWTLVIAVPFTLLALAATAYITEHLNAIGQAILNFSQASTAGGRGLILEFSERWPEVAGMIIGQLVILILLVIVRRSRKVEHPE